MIQYLRFFCNFALRMMKFEIVHIEETDSTNRWMKENGEGDLVVVADYQTAGKGCGSNSWEAERGKNLLFSVLIHPKSMQAKSQFIITQVVSVALCKTLEGMRPLLAPPAQEGETKGGNTAISIKWPNDIYWCDKKISGTLIENELSGESIRQCVLGTGINVNQEHFVSDAPNPVSLRQILGHDVPRDRLFMDFLKHFETFYSRLESGESESLAQQYGDSLYWREGMHPYRDSRGTFRAFIDGVEPDGHLLLRTDEGQVRRYAFKEVSFLITL